MSVLSEIEENALRDTLDDEYRAWATYDQVIFCLPFDCSKVVYGVAQTNGEGTKVQYGEIERLRLTSSS